SYRIVAYTVGHGWPLLRVRRGSCEPIAHAVARSGRPVVSRAGDVGLHERGARQAGLADLPGPLHRHRPGADRLPPPARGSARWFGPDIGQPVYWIILLAILATAGAWHTRYALLLTRTVGDSACQLGRAREEMVIRALTRARELEQIGAKLSHELKNPLAAIKGLVQLSARAACDPDSREQLRVVAAEVDRHESERAARIAVRDSGRGMPPEVLERLGTPFFTTRDEGTGLGVVVARAAFAQHGGSLVYASEPGQGTTATGTLPLRYAHRS